MINVIAFCSVIGKWVIENIILNELTVGCLIIASVIVFILWTILPSR